jgi:hypothetical protein
MNIFPGSGYTPVPYLYPVSNNTFNSFKNDNIATFFIEEETPQNTQQIKSGANNFERQGRRVGPEPLPRAEVRVGKSSRLFPPF